MSKIREFIVNQMAKQAEKLPAEARQAFKPEHQVELELTGEDGGTYHVLWENGEVRLVEGKAPTPLVAVSATAKTFMDMMTGKISPEIDAANIDASGFKMNPITMLAPNKIEHIKKLKGTLRVKVCEGSVPKDEDILSETWMAFNGEPIAFESPRCTVIMPIVSLEKLATGKAAPPQIFMAGGMRAIGDLQLLMLMAPLAN